MHKFDVFVGNIEYTVTDELLVTVFSEVGRVVDIRMKTESSGRPAGYGFIEFADGPTVSGTASMHKTMTNKAAKRGNS